MTMSCVARDLDRMNTALREAGAVVTEPDGFQWIDQSKVPASLVRAYRGITSYAYANGII